MVEFQKMNIDAGKKETIIYRRQMMHYGLYLSQPDDAKVDIPWHWHDEFEIGYVAEGKMLYKTNHHEFILNSGDGIFINSGVPHYLHPLEEQGKLRLHTHFFDKIFLAGSPGSLFDMEYITPVQEQKLLDAVPLYHGSEEGRRFLEKVQEAEDLCLKEELFFELRLRSLFSELWETVYAWAMEKKDGEKPYNSLEDERIKKMLSYIQIHYEEKITAEMLSKEAHISERECYRLFRSRLGTSPAEFMMSLRLQKAQELLRYTEKSIIEIAQETGFGTSSYFCKMFKQKHRLTPNQYRKYQEHRKSSGSSLEEGQTVITL